MEKQMVWQNFEFYCFIKEITLSGKRSRRVTTLICMRRHMKVSFGIKAVIDLHSFPLFNVCELLWLLQKDFGVVLCRLLHSVEFSIVLLRCSIESFWVFIFKYCISSYRRQSWLCTASLFLMFVNSHHILGNQSWVISRCVLYGFEVIVPLAWLLPAKNSRVQSNQPLTSQVVSVGE